MHGQKTSKYVLQCLRSYSTLAHQLHYFEILQSLTRSRNWPYFMELLNGMVPIEFVASVSVY